MASRMLRWIWVSFLGGCGSGPVLELAIEGPEAVHSGIDVVYRAKTNAEPGTASLRWSCSLDDPSVVDEPRPCAFVIDRGTEASEQIGVLFARAPDPSSTAAEVDVFLTLEASGTVRAEETSGSFVKRVRVKTGRATQLDATEFEPREWLTACSFTAEDGRSSLQTHVADLGHPGTWVRSDAVFEDQFSASLGGWYNLRASPSVHACHLFDGAAIDLKEAGGIRNLLFSFDGLGLPVDGSDSLAYAFAALRQGSTIYLAADQTSSGRIFGRPALGWTRVQFPSLEAEDFVAYSHADRGLDTTNSPDFSSAGEPISVGIFLAPYGVGHFPLSSSASYGFDNLRVELDAPRVDFDLDDVPDDVDNCFLSNRSQVDADMNGIGDACQDDDRDSIAFTKDNCPVAFNPTQSDSNDDGRGDACSDSDRDGIIDSADNCKKLANPTQDDGNGNGVGDVCEDVDRDRILDRNDNCRLVPNYEQQDTDRDGQGDSCDLPRVEFEVWSSSGSRGPVFEAYDTLFIKPRYPGSISDVERVMWQLSPMGSIDPHATLISGQVAPECLDLRTISNACGRLQAAEVGSVAVHVSVGLSVPRGGARELASTVNLSFTPGLYSLTPNQLELTPGDDVQLEAVSSYNGVDISNWTWTLGVADTDRSPVVIVGKSSGRAWLVKVPAGRRFVVVRLDATTTEGMSIQREHRFPID